jgi:hypothetical protein
MPNVQLKYYKQNPDLEFVLGKHNGSFVYGGFVRDTLRGVPFQDMDVAVPCLEVAQKFIQNLEGSNRMIHLETKTIRDSPVYSLEYQCFTMEIQTPMTHRLKIDITYSNATSLGGDSLNKCDFTANNLMMDHSGTLSTRIKAYQIGLDISEAEWLARCIRDCIDGKLVWMIPDRFSKRMGETEASQTEFMQKMNMRLQKMLGKGFVETGEHLTSFRLVNVDSMSAEAPVLGDEKPE